MEKEISEPSLEENKQNCGLVSLSLCYVGNRPAWKPKNSSSAIVQIFSVVARQDN